MEYVCDQTNSSYNPVQCPFCNKGHRDNYNLKQVNTLKRQWIVSKSTIAFDPFHVLFPHAIDKINVAKSLKNIQCSLDHTALQRLKFPQK